MSEATRLRWLRIALIANGILALTFIPASIMMLMDSPLMQAGSPPAAALRWHPYNIAYEMMIIVILLVLSLFLWYAASNPAEHRLLILCGAGVFLAHGAVMFVEALLMEGELSHLTGDVLLNFLVGGILLWLHPRKEPVKA
jgi:hypothetical protein